MQRHYKLEAAVRILSLIYEEISHVLKNFHAYLLMYDSGW